VDICLTAGQMHEFGQRFQWLTVSFCFVGQLTVTLHRPEEDPDICSHTLYFNICFNVVHPIFLSVTKIIALQVLTTKLHEVLFLFHPSDVIKKLAKLVPTFAGRECHMFSVTNPYCPIRGFLDCNRYFFFQVAL
jgi:hypothetical protein